MYYLYFRCTVVMEEWQGNGWVRRLRRQQQLWRHGQQSRRVQQQQLRQQLRRKWPQRLRKQIETDPRYPLPNSQSARQRGAGEDPNNPDGKQQLPQQNKDKKVVEEWFKMMGGLYSILQLGVAFLALANFCMTTSKLVKQFWEFSKESSLSIAKYIEDKLPTKTISSLMAPERRGKLLRQLLFSGLRVLALGLLVLGVRMQWEIKQEARRRQEEMEKELRELKVDEVELEEEKDIEQRQKKESEGVEHDANL